MNDSTIWSLLPNFPATNDTLTLFPSFASSIYPFWDRASSIIFILDFLFFVFLAFFAFVTLHSLHNKPISLLWRRHNSSLIRPTCPGKENQHNWRLLFMGMFRNSYNVVYHSFFRGPGKIVVQWENNRYGQLITIFPDSFGDCLIIGQETQFHLTLSV